MARSCKVLSPVSFFDFVVKYDTFYFRCQAIRGPGVNRVFWTVHAPAAAVFPPLHASRHCDVLVVGGGILGCSAAVRLRELGVDVCLLEADAIGSGASGRNGGLVVPSLPRVGPDDAKRLLGETMGQRLISMVAHSAEFVFQRIAHYGLICDAVQQGWIHPCHAHTLIPAMQTRAQAWCNAGGQAVWLDAQATRQRTGSQSYVGAIYDPSGGHLNPLAYTRALAHTAAQLGARIHTATAVQRIQKQGDGWQVQTPSATVHAKSVLQCSHIQNPQINRQITPKLLRSCVPLTVYQLATQVIAPDLRRTLLPDNASLSDSRNNLFACRMTADGRLVAGAMAAITHWRAEARVQRALARRMQRVFPQLGRVQFEYVWSGRAALTPDFLPRIFQLGERWLAPLGCNGRGIAMSTALGFRLADYLVDGNDQHLPVPLRAPAPIAYHAVSQYLPQWLLPIGDLQDRWRR